MFKVTSRIIVFGILLVGLVLSPSIIAARAAPTPYMPGVTQGQWAKYKVLYNTCVSSDPTTCQTYGPGGLSDTDYGLIQVTGVSGTVVTLSLLSVYKNGTSSHQGLQADVSSGTINGTGLGGTSNANYFVLATGLDGNTHDPISMAAHAPTLNSSRTETVLGASRTVNFLNYSFSSNVPNVGSISLNTGFAFDQSSGLFVEVSLAYTTTGTFGTSDAAFAIGMIDNNVWQTSYLPDYNLNANPIIINIVGTATGTAAITPMRLYGFSAKISLTATSSASGIACSLSSSSLSIGSDASTLSCYGSAGSYTVTIRGNGSYIIRTVTVPVNIASSILPDFTISHSGPINFQTGSSGQATITIAALNGYNSATTLEITNPPSGLTCSLDHNSVSGHGSVTLTCSGQPGSYTVTVKASGGGTSHSTDTPVTVSPAPANPDFQISHSGSISFQTGGSGKATITITAQNGYSATTTVQINSVPSGLTCNLDSNTVSGSGSMTLTCTGQPGSYTVTVQATGAGISHSTDTAVTVTAAPASTQPASSSPMLLIYVGIGVVAVAVAGLLGFLFLRKKPE